MRKILTLILIIVLLMPCVPAMAAGYSDMLEKAETYYASGEYAKAIASYQIAQKMQPEDIQALLGEANVHMILEDYGSAIAAIDAALEIEPASPDAWQLKCKVDALLNDIPAFEQDAIFAEVCDTDLSDISPTVASMYFSAGYYDQAVSYFSMTDLASFSDIQREQYRKALIHSGKRETADELGLAYQSVRNAALDAAFDRGNLTLVRAEFPAISAADFEFSDEIWEAYGEEKPKDPIADLATVLPDVTVTWLSLSSAGNSGVLLLDDELEVCYYAGKYHILYPSQTRGVADANGNLTEVFSRHLLKILGEEGVVYSPDGRYAAILNTNYTLGKGFYFLDPIIIDLSTGEMILTATYENTPIREGYGVATTATFSSDGHYFYYMLFGDAAEYHSVLCRYNLQTSTTELCYSGNDWNVYPYLSETADGAFIILRDHYQSDVMTGITSIHYEGGAWQGTEYSFDLPLKYWYCKRLLQSSNSGYAFALGRIGSLGLCAFQRIRPDDDFDGLNRYYAISKESNIIQAYSADEMQSLLMDLSNESSEEDISTIMLDMPFQVILTSTLSPDGHYVLLNTQNYGTLANPAASRHLYILRLDDLAIKEVGGIEPSDILVGAEGASYSPVIEWNSDTLIIGTADGTQAYEFYFQ